MLKISDLQPGTVLWDIQKNSPQSYFKNIIFPVEIIQVDQSLGKALVSWNHSSPQWMSLQSVMRFGGKDKKKIYEKN